MELEYEEVFEPVSPSSQYLASSALSLTIIAVMESEIPIDDSMTMPLLKEVFLPINPRFSSIMIREKKGAMKWKRVEVNLENHVHRPEFAPGMSPEYYEECLTNYISKLAMDQFQQDRPLWEVHILKYPTTNAAGNVLFKLHHSLGDGYSLMGALLSCLQRLDDPSLPLTFPSRQSMRKMKSKTISGLTCVPRFFSRVFNTINDFGFSVLKSTLNEDDCSPIRSGVDGVEFRPFTVITLKFSLDQIKQIKATLNVTINDVITGVITYGIRVYMEQMDSRSSKAKSTALVVLGTRAIGGYKSVSDMIKPNAEMPWGNHFTFLPVSVPKLTADESSNPLTFVMEAHRLIKRKRNSAAVYFTGQLLETIRKVKGPEAASGYVYKTLKNSSMGITNLIGPVEKMALANHPVKGIYFTLAGSPQSISCTMVSYVGELRVCFGLENDHIDPSKFKSCVQSAYDTVFNAALKPSSQTKSQKQL